MHIGGSHSPSEWGEELASTLRLIQIKARHEPVSVRQRLIAEQIKAELLDIRSDLRREYLEALKQCFPAPERIEADSRTNLEDPPARARRLVRELIALSPSLNLETTSKLRQELEDAGFLKSSEPPSLEPEMLCRLGLNPNKKVNSKRLVELSELLIDFAVESDQLAWSYWNQIAPGSSVRPETLTGRFWQSIGRFLESEKEFSSAELKRALHKTASLLTGIFSSLASFAEKYAKRHMETFAPDRIRGSVKSDNPGVGLGVEQKCWRRYTRLALSLNGPSIENQINRIIVSETEATVARNSNRRQAGA